MVENNNKEQIESKKVSNKPTQFVNCRKRRKQKEIMDAILKTLATSNEPLTTREIAEKNGLNTVSCRRYLELLEFGEKVSRYTRGSSWNYWKVRR